MQYELKKCQDQTGMKNDKLDDKTRWELMPLDCLEDIARVYTEGAKKYGVNTWQNLENGYERYKGALLRHLYAAESETFDEETGCRHLAQVAWNAIALLWLSKYSQSQEETVRKQKLIDDFWEVMDSYNEVIKADCDACSSKNAEEDILHERNKYRRETGQDTTESTSDTTVSEADTTGHES